MRFGPPPPAARRVRLLATSYGVVRVGLGAALTVAPSVLARRFAGGLGDGPAVVTGLRLLGVRDLVVGAGTVASSRSGRHARTWARLGALADLFDLVAAVSVSSRIGRTRALLAASAASGGVLTGWWLGRAFSCAVCPGRAGRPRRRRPRRPR